MEKSGLASTELSLTFDRATYVDLKEGQKSYKLPTLPNHDRISLHAKPVLYLPNLYQRALITLTFLKMAQVLFDC